MLNCIKIHIEYVSQLDGHSNINTTSKYYIAKKAKKFKKLVEKADLSNSENSRFLDPDTLMGVMDSEEFREKDNAKQYGDEKKMIKNKVAGIFAGTCPP